MVQIPDQFKDIQWADIDAVIFDLDGTLYKQSKVRSVMIWRLLIHAILGGYRDILIVMHYRQNMEKLANKPTPNLHQLQFLETAKVFLLEEREIKEIIHKWMIIKPLDILKKSVYPDVNRLFKILRGRGIKIGIFSDYPAVEKLKILGLEVDAICSSTEKDVSKLKPNPAGLLKVLDQLNTNPVRAIMIGDREDRDLLCANSLGVPCLIRRGDKFFVDLANFLDGKN